MAAQLTKGAVRIRGIIERARALLVTATQGSVTVFCEHSETGDALETVVGDIDTALMHFGVDTKRYHDAQVKRVKLTEGKQKGTRPRNERVPPRPPAPPAPQPKRAKSDHRETVS